MLQTNSIVLGSTMPRNRRRAKHVRCSKILGPIDCPDEWVFTEQSNFYQTTETRREESSQRPPRPAPRSESDGAEIFVTQMLIPDMCSAADLHFLLVYSYISTISEIVRVFLSWSVGNPEIFPFVGAKLLNRPVTKMCPGGPVTHHSTMEHNIYWHCEHANLLTWFDIFQTFDDA